YYHHTTVSFDYMLRRYYEESRGEFEIPAEPEQFLRCDDVALMQALRTSTNPWAMRIITRQGYKLLAQFTERDEGYDLGALEDGLASSRVDHFSVQSLGVLSKSFDSGGSWELFVPDVSSGRLTEIARYTPLYQRYSAAVQLSRVYVRPDQIGAARAVLESVTNRGSL